MAAIPIPYQCRPYIASRLKMGREMRGYSRRELAELLESDPKIIAQRERNEVATSLGILFYTADALDLSVGYFLPDRRKYRRLVK